MNPCQTCASPIPDGAAFCPRCGTRLAAVERATAAMRTERKVLTVLFADIKSSIDLVARHDPEAAGDVLADIVGDMGRAVRAYGGVVNQVLGDGIMALFGAPLALEEHAAAACRAALAIRDAVRLSHPGIQLRTGIGSGEVVVRALTGDMTVHYGAAGEAVHFASRLEQAAAADQILITATTLALAAGLPAVRALGKLRVKGLDEPIEAFELLGIAERRGHRRQAAQARLVGRGPEMSMLADALGRAASGHASGVRIVAEAGCGKSRLVAEFTGEHLPPDWSLAKAEALPHRRTSYGAALSLLRGAIGIDPGDDQLTRADKLHARLALRPDDTDLLLAPLAPLLGLDPLPGWSALDARERRLRTIAGTADALRRAGRRHPLAVIVEDAHWLDPESAETIQRLGIGNGGLRLLAIATERPPTTVFTDHGAWAECRLSALDGADTHALLDELLLPGPDTPRLKRMLLERTRGNPLFIEECLEALVDVGDLQRVGPRYRLDQPLQQLSLPLSLRALLDARVDRLEATEKDVLQAASVVGTTVRADLLGLVAGRDAAEIDPVLDRLALGGFLVESGSALDTEAAPRRFAFRHGLIRDAAYNGILLKTRVRMHGAVLEALERSAIEEDVDLLADHASRAEAWAKAVRYARQAATRALDRYANPEALHYYRQALGAAERWPDGPEKERTRLGLHIGVRWPLFRLGQVRDLLPHLDQAAVLAARYDDHEQLGQSHALRSHGLWLAGRPAEAESAAEAARALAREKADRDLDIRGLFQRALVHLTSGRSAELVAALEAVIAHIGDQPPTSARYGLDADLVVTALGYVARAHAATGDLAAAHDALNRAGASARDLGRRQAWIYVHVAHGVVLLADGRPHQAVGQFQAAYDACKDTDIRLLQPVAAGFLALACIESGDLGRGRAIAQEAVDDAERMGFLALQPLRLAILAEACLLGGDLDQAERSAAAAASLALEIREPGAEAFATGLRGEIAARRGDAERADMLFRAGLSQAEGLLMQPLAACIRRRLEHPGDRAHPWLDGLPLAP